MPLGLVSTVSGVQSTKISLDLKPASLCPLTENVKSNEVLQKPANSFHATTTLEATIKTPLKLTIINFEHISHLFLVFLLF